ncbi:S1/P1 nuclease [Aspergillus terreus]|uniref:S1/P1 nuclease n=1 Tax=Aspergillus terreus TaxID=33178 RepID=A0A5M3ZCS5_ASPTE|nr:hypothetical protein ATETN484_0013038000 [Aspergillus terreus]GFF20613.1 S1/P1 nuclease [Aspergillus terreus]
MQLALAFAVLLICQCKWALAWGDVGHRTVAYVAENYLTEDGSRFIDNLLPFSKNFDISDAATWADEQKRRYPKTKPWHYVDIEDDPVHQKCDISSMDCPKGDCIVSAMEAMTSQVREDSFNRTEAVLFLVHFFGDLHMPLHVEGFCRGGNDIDVSFNGRNDNLHSIWDTDMPHKINGIKHSLKHNDEKTASLKWAKDLIQKNLHRPATVTECNDVTLPQKCFKQWATESNHLNSGDYYEDAVPVIEEQIFKAGVRLATWINSIAEKPRAKAAFVAQGSGSYEL